MMIKTVTERKSPILVAGVLALLSQGAWSEEKEQDVRETAATDGTVTVTAPRQPTENVTPRFESNTSEAIEALNRRLARDLEEALEAIGHSRIELVITEVPTRG